MFMNNSSHLRRARGLALAGAAGTALVAAGCGGSSHGGGSGPASSSGVAVSAATGSGAAVAVPDTTPVSAQKRHDHFDPRPNVAKVVKLRAVVHHARVAHAQAVPQAPSFEVRSTGRGGPAAVTAAHTAATAGPGPRNPCGLVTKAEARTILKKRSVSVVTAPQGPTCIYEPKGTKLTVTLAVQKVDLASIRKSATQIKTQKVGSHRLYCLRYGTTMTYVPLTGRNVLSIGASCSTGAAFARKALPRL
jgi:hypothetical protein